jgi:hypothetical protein
MKYLAYLLILLTGCAFPTAVGRRAAEAPNHALPPYPPGWIPQSIEAMGGDEDFNQPPVAHIEVVSTNAIIPPPTGLVETKWGVTNNVLVIEYQAVPDQFYALQWTTNLCDWSFLSGAISSGGIQYFGAEINNVVGLPSTVFFRVVTGPPP